MLSWQYMEILKEKIEEIEQQNTELRKDIETLLKHEQEQEQFKEIMYQERDELRTALEASRQVSEIQKAQIEKLTEMLRKCSPFVLDDDGGNSKAESICGFCGIEEDYNILGDGVHKHDCKYIAMTKED